MTKQPALLLVLLAAATAWADPTKGEVSLPAHEGWRASLVIVSRGM